MPITADGQLQTPDDFRHIGLNDGCNLTIGDLARVELGTQSFGFGARDGGAARSGWIALLGPFVVMLATG